MGSVMRVTPFAITGRGCLDSLGSLEEFKLEEESPSIHPSIHRNLPSRGQAPPKEKDPTPNEADSTRPLPAPVS